MNFKTTKVVLLAGCLISAGCVTNEPKKTEAAPQAEAAAAPAPAPQAAAPAPASPAKPVCKTEPAKTTSKKTSTKTTAKKGTTTQATQDPACVEPTAAPAQAAAASPSPTPVPAPAPAPAAATSSGSYDLSRNKPVTDSTKVESGQGTKVKGINDWEGEITGVPFAGAKFTKLKIGMPLKQVTDLIGEPTDQGAYVTGKAFIPFYFGSDRARWETTYKGQGRLIFSNQSGFGTGQYLTWVIYNPNEPGYR